MAEKPHIMVVEARFYDDVSDHLLVGAKAALDSAQASYRVFTVPGALEVPAAIKTGAAHFDAFVALGCVIRGETTHYDVVCQESMRALTALSMEHNILIGNGILTCEDKAQALMRADPAQKNKGAAAVEAALSLIAIREAVERSA